MADLARHPDVVDLAEYAEGTLDPARQPDVEQHVRECAECTRTLADLAGLPETLSQAPVPPMPAEVADRLDRAIAAEASARATATSAASDATVVPMRPRRRWLAPVLAAAAVVGVIGIAVPVLDNGGQDSDDAGGSEASNAQRDQAGRVPNNGGADRTLDGETKESLRAETQRIESLSSATFGRDVARIYFPDQDKRPLPEQSAIASDDQRRYVRAVEGLCPLPDDLDLPGGWIVPITLDGDPAHLLLSQPPPVTDAVAFTCDGSDPRILATTTLEPR